MASGLGKPSLSADGRHHRAGRRIVHEAAETHHVVYRIVDGDDSDWASWYAEWLLNLSELPQLLNETPVRSHLVHALVQLDRDYTAAPQEQRWEDWYAHRLVERWG